MTGKPFTRAAALSPRVAALSLCAALSACGGKGHMTNPAPIAWRQVATEDDRDRLRNWRQAWTDALAKVAASKDAGALPAGTPLFDPDRALPGATPPPGRYTCRVTKLGANGPAMRDLTVYPAAECRVASEGGVATIYKISGAQRPVGKLYADGPARVVFLGTLVFGDETKPFDYGEDTQRDLAGYVERVGERRWRLVLPYPHFESLLDVIDLTPAAATP